MSKAADYPEILDMSVEDDTKLISLGEQLERRVCEFFDALACLSNDSTSIECLSNDGPSTAIESLIEQILPLSATSIAGLRAKALVVWFEARPRWLCTGPHHHEWGWQNDGAMSLRTGPGCLNNFSASISGASAGVRLPSGGAAG
jgi:hypothetical protein